LLESAHVKDVLSLLRVSVNPQDDLAWMRFLTLWDGVGDVGADWEAFPETWDDVQTGTLTGTY
jgi:superfamily I DNA/RNA helicase